MFPHVGRIMWPVPSRPKIEQGLPRWMHLQDTEMESQARQTAESKPAQAQVLVSLTAIMADHGRAVMCHLLL